MSTTAPRHQHLARHVAAAGLRARGPAGEQARAAISGARVQADGRECAASLLLPLVRGERGGADVLLL